VWPSDGTVQLAYLKDMLPPDLSSVSKDIVINWLHGHLSSMFIKNVQRLHIDTASFFFLDILSLSFFEKDVVSLLAQCFARNITQWMQGMLLCVFS
jgi:hypothetical protein